MTGLRPSCQACAVHRNHDALDSGIQGEAGRIDGEPGLIRGDGVLQWLTTTRAIHGDNCAGGRGPQVQPRADYG